VAFEQLCGERRALTGVRRAVDDDLAIGAAQFGDGRFGVVESASDRAGEVLLLEPARPLRVEQGDITGFESLEELPPVDLARHQCALAPKSAVSSSTV